MERAKILLKSALHSFFPKLAVERVLGMFVDSKPEEPRRCVLTGVIDLGPGRVFVRDMWGRDSVVDLSRGIIAPADASERELGFRERPEPDPLLVKLVSELDDAAIRKLGLCASELPRLREAREIAGMRKVFSNVYGQAPVLPYVNSLRLAAVKKYADGDRVLLIGDNDATSILLAMDGYRATVIDVDEYVCRFLNSVAREFGVRVDVRLIDVRKPFVLEGEFDAFLTDPEHTVACMTLFVIRGMERTRRGGVGVISWEASFFQRRHLRYLLRRLGAEVLSFMRRAIRYVSPLPDFYEHLRRMERPRMSIPKWKGDLWVVRVGREVREFREKELPIAIY